MDLIIMKERRINNNLVLLLFFFMLFSWSACRETSKSIDRMVFVKDAEINEDNFRQLDHGFIIKFSHVLEDSEKPNVLVPIYRGTMGNVRLSQLMNKLKRRESVLGTIVIETGKGKVKEGILDCVNFYIKNLLKNTDIKTPSVIGLEDNTGMFIWYDYDYEGIPGTIMIGAAYDHNCEEGKFNCKYRNIEDIEVNENAIGFTISIGIGEKSSWRVMKEKGEK